MLTLTRKAASENLLASYSSVAIPDTSFYSDFSRESRLWTACALRAVGKGKAPLVCPATIREEYEGLYFSGATNDLGYRIAAMHPDDIFGEGEVSAVSVGIASVAQAVSGYVRFAPKAMTSRINSIKRDATVVFYALHFAKTKERVYVLAADTDIIYSVQNLMKEEGIDNIVMLAPRESLEAELYGYVHDKENPKQLECILAEDVPSMANGTAAKYSYVAIARNVPITSNFKCDVGFDVVEKPFGRSITLPDETYLAPIMTINEKAIRKQGFNPFRDFPGYSHCFLRIEEHGAMMLVRQRTEYADGRVRRTPEVSPFYLVNPVHFHADGRQVFAGKKSQLASALSR